MSVERKREWLRDASDEALLRIVASLATPARDQPANSEYPLGGRVHIEGVGYVEVRAIRQELHKRAQRARR